VKDLGFIKYVRSLPDRDGRVFPLLTRVGKRYTHGFSQWFLRFRKRAGVSEDTKVFHSFRHTFQTALAVNDVADLNISMIVGHTEEGQTKGRYNKRFEPKMLKEKAIDKLKYDLDLSHLKKSRWAF
jgi:integrase